MSCLNYTFYAPRLIYWFLFSLIEAVLSYHFLCPQKSLFCLHIWMIVWLGIELKVENRASDLWRHCSINLQWVLLLLRSLVSILFLFFCRQTLSFDSSWCFSFISVLNCTLMALFIIKMIVVLTLSILRCFLQFWAIVFGYCVHFLFSLFCLFVCFIFLFFPCKSYRLEIGLILYHSCLTNYFDKLLFLEIFSILHFKIYWDLKISVNTLFLTF